ncbi:MAG: pilus assembly protein TadG-related protein, partial [Omnitrophica WOR_2 bacterium]
MKSNHIKENGQIIIMLALVMVALLGFTGLAIDGGMVYSDRRN